MKFLSNVFRILVHMFVYTSMCVSMQLLFTSVLCVPQNPSFKKLLIDTVLDGIEKNLHIPLDRKSLIFLRMPYKGVPISTVLRERTKDVRTVLLILAHTLTRRSLKDGATTLSITSIFL